MSVSSCCTLYKGDFKAQRNFPVGESIWDHPNPFGASKIETSYISAYNSLVLQTICNIRNQCLNSEKHSETRKKLVSALCAASMVLSAIIIGVPEALIRFAIGIIGLVGLISLLWKGIEDGFAEENNWLLPMWFGIVTSFASSKSCLVACKSAWDCFEATIPVSALLEVED